MRVKVPQDLAGFVEWLRARRLAAEHRAPYYAQWVQRFLGLRAARPRETWSDTLTVFLEDLGEGHCPPWLIRQAADAVTLYCGQYCERLVTEASPSRATGAAFGHRPPAAEEAPCPAAPSALPRLRRPGSGRVSSAGPAGAGAPTASPARTAAEGRPTPFAALTFAPQVPADPPLSHAELLQEVQRLLRLRHYAARTERTYLGWARRFLAYVAEGGQRPAAAEDVKAYLSFLAIRQRVSAAIQNQAYNALLFLCRHVLMVDLGDLGTTVRARQGQRLPVVLSPEETRAVFSQLSGTWRLMLELAYGGGLRVSELVALRVKDIDFDAGTATVRAGKGDKDRVTFLPRRLVPELQKHLEQVRALHQRDLAAGAGDAPLPDGLERKYPNAGKEWGWQFAFPAAGLVVDERGVVRRWHVATASVQKAMKRAVRRSGIAKPASVHSLRHSLATSLLVKGADIRRVQDLLGHKSVETTMIYTHVLQSLSPDLASPLDEL